MSVRNDMIQDYGYDIGYYEGVRNTLQIIHRTLMMKELSEEERVELLLKEVGDELDDAIIEQKESEKIMLRGY